MRCENCNKILKNEDHYMDSEGIDLCYKCFIECCVLPGHKDEIERLKKLVKAAYVEGFCKCGSRYSYKELLKKDKQFSKYIGKKWKGSVSAHRMYDEKVGKR